LDDNLFSPNLFARKDRSSEKVNFSNNFSVLVFQDTEENELVKRANPKIYRKRKNPGEKFLDYILNNIPSDFYLMKYSDQVVSKNFM